ncbi:MAG: EAL domain-containing protein [Gaiellaceae bacterium]
MTALPRRWCLLCGFLVAVGMAVLAYLRQPAIIHEGATLACAGAIALGSTRLRARRISAPWYLLAAGALLLFVVEIEQQTNDHLLSNDVFRVTGYAVLAVGIGTLVTSRRNGRDWASLIDTAAIVAATVLVVLVFLIEPLFTDPTASLNDRIIVSLFVLSGLALIAVAIRYTLDLRNWTRSTGLLLNGAVLLGAASISWAALQLRQSAGLSLIAQLEQISALMLIAAAAFDSTSRNMRISSAERIPQLTPGRMVMLGVASAIPPIGLAIQTARNTDGFEILVTVACLVIIDGLVLARLAALILRQRRAARRELLLRRASHELAIADERDQVCETVVETAVALAREHGRARGNIVLGSGANATQFAARGEAMAQPFELSVPLALRSTQLGELVVESERPLGEETIAALNNLASQVVSALGNLQRTKSLLEERKELESELMRQSNLDPLTALPNRAYFLENVDAAIGRMKVVEEPVSVMLVNLDDFKTVNDTLGYVAGDELLRQISDRLIGCIRTDDTCARLGSDEWAILIKESPPESPSAVAARIMTALERSLVLLGQHEIFAHASIGSATITIEDPRIDGAELLRNAEVAMFHAKRHDRTGFEAFEPAMRAAVAERLALKAELEQAIEHKDFVIHYQPIILLDNGHICGVEALVRWNHPERGLIPPFHFIPLAEETGLIIPLGRFVLNEALRQGREWQELTGRPELVISVNLSGRQLDNSLLVSDVAKALEETGIEPETVILEITETALTEDVESAVERLHELKTLGIQLAIDDFGTGYSSLQYLRRFPADIIKVAKPFVDGVVERQSDEYRIADAIIRLGETFGLRALAEGIELPEQREMLRELRCELGQGFLFAKPLEPDALEELLLTPSTAAFASL